MQIKLTKEQITSIQNGGIVFIDIDDVIDEQWHTTECAVFMETEQDR